MSTMVELIHSDPDLFTKGNHAIEWGNPLVIRVTGPAVRLVSEACRLYDEYLRQKAQGRKNRILLLQFGWYGIRISSLWGVLNSAGLHGAAVMMSRDGDHLQITIAGVGNALEPAP